MAKPRQYVILQLGDDATAEMFYRTDPAAALKPVKRDLREHRRIEVAAIWAAWNNLGQPFMFYYETEGWSG